MGLVVRTKNGLEGKGVFIMKKEIVILFISFFIFINGCKADNGNSEMAPTVDEGVFRGVVSYIEVDLNNKDGAVNKDEIINEKLALEIGNSVLKSVYGEDIIDKTRFVVYEIENENIFVVSRLPKGKEFLGGDRNVAIRKTDGAILKIWAGE